MAVSTVLTVTAATALSDFDGAMNLNAQKPNFTHKEDVERIEKEHKEAVERFEKEHKEAVERIEKEHKEAYERIEKDCEACNAKLRVLPSSFESKKYDK